MKKRVGLGFGITNLITIIKCCGGISYKGAFV